MADVLNYPPQVRMGLISEQAYVEWNRNTVAMKSPRFLHGRGKCDMRLDMDMDMDMDMSSVFKQIADNGIDTSMFEDEDELPNPFHPSKGIPAYKGIPEGMKDRTRGKGVKGLPPVRRGKGVKGLPPVRQGKGVKGLPPVRQGKGVKGLPPVRRSKIRRRKVKRRKQHIVKEDISLLTPKEVRSQLPSGIDIISITEWEDDAKPFIENGDERFLGVGKPKFRIFKRRSNTRGKGEFRCYDDGTLVFIFDDPPPGMTLERTRVVLIAEPNDEGEVVSINVFANAYNIPCGNTGQKNGKEFFFSKNWRDNENYTIYARLMGVECDVEVVEEEEEEEDEDEDEESTMENEDSF